MTNQHLHREARHPLRIAIVHAADVGRGAEQCVMALHRGLRALGHASTLYVGSRQSDEPGVVEIPYRRGLPGSRRLARALERRLGWQDLYNPSFRHLIHLIPPETDVVHFHSLWGSGGYADLGALPAISARWPSLISLHETWLLAGHCACFHGCARWRHGCGACPDLTLAPAIPRDGTWFNWHRKRWLVARSRLHLVTVSDWLAGIAQSSPILAGKPVTRIYNGIDHATFTPVTTQRRTELRRALGIPEGAVTVLLAGQTVEGIREGIAAHRAIAALNRLAPGLLVPVIVGQSAMRVAEQLTAPAIVLPFQTTTAAMAGCYQAVDLCLVASEVETFGRIGAEAQACGTPVIAFAAGGIPEVVRDGVGGWIVPVGDVTGLVTALERLATDAAQRARLAQGGRAYVESHFDQTTVAAQHVALYREILARGRT